MKRKEYAYKTRLGFCVNSKIEEALNINLMRNKKGKVNLIFTSPPFPLNRKKKYGNKLGQEYVDWIVSISKKLKDYLADDGSFVIEIGNSWEPGLPVMSTLALKTLLAIQEECGFYLCQNFVWYNTAKLPSPAQWVNVERIRVKDSFTNIWWLSKSPKPKADNKKVKNEYSESMKKLLRSKSYNSGLRPSEHLISEETFLKDNKGSIASNVLIGANTQSSSKYITYCKDKKIELHPARMPSFIPEFFIKFLTKEGDLVLDPFGGSNTTGEVAEKLSRKWITIEPNKEYVKGSKGRFIPGR